MKRTIAAPTREKTRKYCSYRFVLLGLIPLTAQAQSLAVCPLPSGSWLTAEFFGDSAQATWRDGFNNLHMLMGSSTYDDGQNRHVQHKSGSTTLASVMDYPTDNSTVADLSSIACNTAYTYGCNPNSYSSYWRHAWPEAIDWDSNGGNHLNMFYTEEVPTCPINSQGLFVDIGSAVSCTYSTDCIELPNPGDDVTYWRDCYQGKCMGMRRPRMGVARSFDNGATWTDVGVIVYNGVSPEDDVCLHTKVYNMAGGIGDEGIATEISPTDSQKYYYIFGSNYQGGDATNTLNQGIVVARIKAADIGNPTASAYFYNSTTSEWNIRIPNALNGTLKPSSEINDGAGHYFSHYVPGSGWTTDSASIPTFSPENSWKSDSNGQFLEASVHFNAALAEGPDIRYQPRPGTFVMAVAHLREGPPYPWYFDTNRAAFFGGTSLEAEPLYWRSFDPGHSDTTSTDLGDGRDHDPGTGDVGDLYPQFVGAGSTDTDRETSTNYSYYLSSDWITVGPDNISVAKTLNQVKWCSTNTCSCP